MNSNNNMSTEINKNEPKTKDEKQFIRMTTEPIGKLLFALSVPTILSMLVTTIYNIVDAAFVGLLGTSQSAATGVVNGYMAILQAIAFMCGQGAGSIVSRKLGKKEKSEADMYATSGVCLSFSLAAIVAIVSYINMPSLLRMLGSTETIMPYARTYLLYIMVSAPVFASSFTLNNLLRYEGKAKFGTVALMTGAILNIAGDAIFICVFKIGIAGAGLSTAISQFTGFIIISSMYFRKKTAVDISLKHLSKSVKCYLDIITTGLPSLLRQSLNAVASMALNRCASVYGDAAVSAMSIVSRLGFFPMAMAIGIGQGFQPISGYNYGANKKGRVREAFFKALRGEEILLFLASVPMFIFAPSFVKILRDDADVIIIGTRALRLICIAQLFVPLTMMTEMGFQSMGQKVLAIISSSLRSGVLFIPTLFILARVRGLNGIQEAQPMAFVLTFIISLYMLKRYLKILKA